MAAPADLYRDTWIACTDQGVVIRGYRFPWGDKSIAYRDIRSVTTMQIGRLTGRWRLWGSADLRHWWHLDPRRPSKETALVLDVGRRIQPIITPDHPGTVRDIIESHRT